MPRDSESSASTTGKPAPLSFACIEPRIKAFPIAPSGRLTIHQEVVTIRYFPLIWHYPVAKHPAFGPATMMHFTA
eukprot:6730421-Pyramimonas_sp.AAC.1